MITNLSNLVHRRVRFEYARAALSCSMNGGRIKGEGWVERLDRKHPNFSPALVVLTGGGYGKYIDRREITEVRINKRWRKVTLLENQA